jgi:hypothetical protein
MPLDADAMVEPSLGTLLGDRSEDSIFHIMRTTASRQNRLFQYRHLIAAVIGTLGNADSGASL